MILLLPCSWPPKQEGRGSVLAVGDGGGSRNPNKRANFFFSPYPSLLLPSPFLLSHLHPWLKNVGGEAQWDLWGSGGGVLRPLNDWNPPLVEDVSPNVELSILQSGLKTPILGASKIPPMG